MPPDRFELESPFSPTGDQPAAIEGLVAGIAAGKRHQVLLGATGTGKTFTMANTIAQVQRPTLIISHNKTLAAQLYEEMKELFPRNAVSYFVSYYDYYQPEAYIPQRDIYIEKDASRNPDLDRLRLAATSHLLSRRDCIVVASVSCLYGLGSPAEYGRRIILVERGRELDRRTFLLGLARMQYRRRDLDLERGTFRVRGDCIELHPAHEEFALRIDLFGDEVERVETFDPLSGELLGEHASFFIFPAVHYVTPEDHMQSALAGIRAELDERLLHFRSKGLLLEAERIRSRTLYDLELLEETGTCPGVENYARWFDGRAPGERAFTLLDYFMHGCGEGAGDWLVIIDESHVTIPQIRGMYFGDRSRKQTLVDHGFRLPSALDNRPLRFEEFEALVPQTVHVSATPSEWEIEQAGGVSVEQVIRPTGLVDPPIDVRGAARQVPDLVEMARERSARGERTLVTALTKRLCEDLTRFLHEAGLRVRYLHSEIDTLERLEILRDLRLGEFDILVGVNLLREGLDLPEVSLVCILDADKQGFLRSRSSLIQTMGRAARNANSLAILYADTITPEMQSAIDEVNRRREKQIAYNEANGITATTIRKAIRRGIEQELAAGRTVRKAAGARSERQLERGELERLLENEMLEAAKRLEFEKAAALRDRLQRLRAAGDGAFEAEADAILGVPSRGGERPPGAAGSRAGRTGPKRTRGGKGGKRGR
jgi:excinuclease ABC subunit B